MLLVFLPLLSALLFSSSIPSIKRNLVQESFTQKKVELLSLLSQTSRTKTKQKIEDLVNTFVLLNPLSTTTDSNLLDGDWALAYHTTATASEQDKKFGQRTSPLFSHHLCFNLEVSERSERALMKTSQRAKRAASEAKRSEAKRAANSEQVSASVVLLARFARKPCVAGSLRSQALMTTSILAMNQHPLNGYRDD